MRLRIKKGKGQPNLNIASLLSLDSHKQDPVEEARKTIKSKLKKSIPKLKQKGMALAQKYQMHSLQVSESGGDSGLTRANSGSYFNFRGKQP